jgi:hypothetical protein
MRTTDKIDRGIYNVILIHVARTWERTRVNQPFGEMPIDNIASTDTIEEIATDIYNNDIIQGFVNLVDKRDYWIKNTADGMSDTYIENEALQIINNEIVL